MGTSSLQTLFEMQVRTGQACPRAVAQGLGELYEEDYQKAAGFAAEDAEEPLRQEVGLCTHRRATVLRVAPAARQRRSVSHMIGFPRDSAESGGAVAA